MGTPSSAMSAIAGLLTPIVSTGRPPTDSQGGRIVQDRERDEATRTKEAGGQRSSVYIGQVRKQERQNMIYNDAVADSFSARTYLCKRKKRTTKRQCRIFQDKFVNYWTDGAPATNPRVVSVNINSVAVSTNEAKSSFVKHFRTLFLTLSFVHRERAFRIYFA